MEIEKAQQVVDDWIKTIGVRYFNELTNLALLTEEVGELARIISRKYGEQSFKKNETDAVNYYFSNIYPSVMKTPPGEFLLTIDNRFKYIPFDQ